MLHTNLVYIYLFFFFFFNLLVMNENWCIWWCARGGWRIVDWGRSNVKKKNLKKNQKQFLEVFSLFFSPSLTLSLSLWVLRRWALVDASGSVTLFPHHSGVKVFPPLPPSGSPPSRFPPPPLPSVIISTG